MLLSATNSDAGLHRLEAAALTELALGQDRETTCFRLACIMLGLLSEVDADGAPVARVADGLRNLADRLEA